MYLSLVSFFENEMHKILWDFEIQTDHPIPVRRPDVVLIKKYNFSTNRSSRPYIENKRKRKHEYLDLTRELKQRGTWSWL